MIASDTDSFQSNDNEEINESYEEEDSNNNLNLEEQEQKEEQDINDILEEVEFGKILKAKQKLTSKSIKEQHKDKQIDKSKHQLKDKFNNINKEKLKDAPKECSALLKPSKLYKYNQKQSSNNTDRAFRDPRFDNMSGGNTTYQAALKKYAFVEDQSKEFLNSLDKLKKRKNFKFTDEEHDIIKENKNITKNFLSNIKHKKIEGKVKEKIWETNKTRKETGKNTVYIKKKDMKTLVTEEKKKDMNSNEEKKFLKRKLHQTKVKMDNMKRPFMKND